MGWVNHCPWNNEAHGLSQEGWLCRSFTPYFIQIIFLWYRGGLVGYYWNTVLYIPEWSGRILIGICQWIGYIIGWVLLELFTLYSYIRLTKISYFEYDNGFDRIWTAEAFLYIFIITQGGGFNVEWATLSNHGERFMCKIKIATRCN